MTFFYVNSDVRDKIMHAYNSKDPKLFMSLHILFDFTHVLIYQKIK